MSNMFELPPGRKYTDYIFTYSGQAIYPEELRPEQVKLVDIAYHLAGIYRYNGATRISVLRHSIALATLCNNAQQRICALFHDAAEAYLMDVPVPKKRFMRPEWQVVHDLVQDVIFKKYKVPPAVLYPGSWEAVMRLDKEVVEYEMNSRERGEPGNAMRYPAPAQMHPNRIEFIDMAYNWKLSDAELIPLFMRRVREYQGSSVVLKECQELP